MSIPLWAKFPAHSPTNMYLFNVYERSFPSDIKQRVSEYRPDQSTFSFVERMFRQQKESPPVSTMPSMHIAWSVVLVYFFFKVSRWSLVFSVPWFFLSALGTVYLAQHYFVDILAGLPVGILAIAVSRKLVSLEALYYKGSPLYYFSTVLIRDGKAFLDFIFSRSREFLRLFPILPR